MAIQCYDSKFLNADIAADLNQLHVLPTDQIVRQLLGYAQAMVSHDYDIDEMVRICLEALDNANKYPHSFESEVMLPPQPETGYCENDYMIIHQMLRLLYDTLHRAISAVRLYDTNGTLTCPCFFIYQDDVALFSVG